jgi:homoserine O-acetyltransferase/O-succinyltransferase
MSTAVAARETRVSARVAQRVDAWTHAAAARAGSRGSFEAPATGARTVPDETIVDPPSGDVLHQGTHVVAALTLESGEVLRDVKLRYTLLGSVNADASNVVLVTHALTGTADVHEWWAPIVGADRALDTSTHAVLCVNALGGCAGSTGPSVTNASDFPAITTRDQALALWTLLDAFGISQLALAVGGSLGGMVALEVAALRPACVGEVVVLAAPAAQTALGAGWHAIMRTAVAVGGAHQGLALARMAGMLSYRSAAGFEERFGSARDADGTPAIAGWLTRHGERLVARFDATSYVTLLDAMDRHDVARGRGSLTQALGAIADRITGVGIPGDLLYPDEVVRQWTQEIGARYVALDSVHGHDAFLLEVPQVAAIVRDALARSTARRAATQRPTAPCIALAGCGVVGDAFALALSRNVSPAATLTRVLVRSPERARPGLHALAAAGRIAPDVVTRDADTLLAGERDVLVEALGGVEPARTLVVRALRRGVRVITVNKELIAAHGPELLALAATHGTTLDFEGAVGAAIPIVRVLRAGSLSAPIARVDAILNGTTNYVLDAIALGDSLPDAIAAAQLAGYAEADPSRDLDGRDAEAKLRILAWLAFGIDPRALHVTRRGVDNAVARWTRIAARSGDAVRILATLEVTVEGLRGTIRPVRVSGSDDWAGVRGVGNRIVLRDIAGGTLTLQGDGAGGAATARAILADLRWGATGTKRPRETFPASRNRDDCAP